MRIAFIEPHLKLFGGIRHVLEIGNELVRLGHEVRVYVPRGQSDRCTWMECLPEVRYLGEPEQDDLDAVIFNNEPDCAWLGDFERARLRVFWLLHFALLYDKAFSWVSYRAPIDLYLAESRWIAQCLQREIGVRAVVINSGVNPRHFRPLPTPKTYEVLCYGDREREWKGTADIEAACRQLGLPLERYDGKGVPQERMAEEYCRARVFVHGSWYEGFGLPGLEALACGVPLVSTDSGGPRDYAYHEETALLVPPRDSAAMAAAITRLRHDPALAEKLSRQGLELVAKQFQWPEKAKEVERVLERALALGPVQPLAPAGIAVEPLHRAPPVCDVIEIPDAGGSPGLGRKLNAALAAGASELVVIAAHGDRTGDPAAVASDLIVRGAALACADTGGLAVLPGFSGAPPLTRWVGVRERLRRSGGFGEGLQGHAGTEDFLLWNLWWQGERVLGPSATFVRPRSRHLLRTFAARGAALARFLYGVPERAPSALRPYGVEARWANGPASVPSQTLAEAMAAGETRVLDELDRQREQLAALPAALREVWSEHHPSVSLLVREERERRLARDELMRAVREEKQANGAALQALTERYSEGQAQWHALLAERELVRASFAERVDHLQAAARTAWNVLVLLIAVAVALVWRPAVQPSLAGRALLAAALATAAHVLWRSACAVADEHHARSAEGG